jgi:hypothetical protein
MIVELSGIESPFSIRECSAVAALIVDCDGDVHRVRARLPGLVLNETTVETDWIAADPSTPATWYALVSSRSRRWLLHISRSGVPAVALFPGALLVSRARDFVVSAVEWNSETEGVFRAEVLGERRAGKAARAQ